MEKIRITNKSGSQEEMDIPKSRVYNIKVRTTNAYYRGDFYSIYPDRRLSDIINMLEQFVTLKDVENINSGEKFPFILINKNFIESIELLKEPESS